MRKIFYIVFLFFISLINVFASNNIKIISREEWWANENFRFIDSQEWINILKKREDDIKKHKDTVYSQKQVDLYKAKQKKVKKMNEILLNDYWEYIKVSSKIKTENWRNLAWPIEKTNKINGIVIHHTYTKYGSDIESLKKIYKYHALSKQWGDIWYNYLIWKDWKIYEWRAGWDYVVAAHTKWNNRATVWIAVIWDYSNTPININQYNALKWLTKYLIKKYDINLANNTYFHSECFWNNCNLPLKTEFRYPIIGHRDAWNTAWPWNALYKQIWKLNTELLKEPISVANIYKKKIFKILSKFSDEKLIDLLAKIEDDLDKVKSSNKLKLKWLIIDYFKDKNQKKYLTVTKKENKIKIKLSYPDSNKISIKSWNLDLNITRRWDNIYIKWKKFNILKIPKKNKDSILEITSWNRVPKWDKLWKYNDNKFRWDIYVYARKWELIVVNSLEIEDYLKWLWEVSDYENIEKIKTIIISARSYATWYTTKAKKFKWKFYDWSDDPNVFQKYLWYGLELRSPNINKIVDETNWELITFEWELIKPWYFSSSNWYTMSFYEYCKIRYDDNICVVEAKKYPYLQSVIDKWSNWMVKRWHGVWISGSWVSYFAKKWWSYDMIIKYFLKWVDVL